MRHERAMRGITSADLGRSADVAKTLMSMGICGEDTHNEISESGKAKELGGGSGRSYSLEATPLAIDKWECYTILHMQ
jgi:hypothetical protein